MNAEKPKLVVSACLLGERCRYNGGHNEIDDPGSLAARFELIPVCPEVAGGLSTPRPAAEIVGDRVLRANGEDVTAEFQTGVRKSMRIVKESGAQHALLKDRSPSCGCGTIHDGTFSATIMKGAGLFTQALKQADLKCVSEIDIASLLDEAELVKK